MDRLDCMRSFVCVAEEGGFSAASRRLGWSTSLVSKYVRHLEDSLGARLLDRTTRRVSLTEAGRSYLERCQRILTDVEEAEAALSNQQGQAKGLLRIAAPRVFGDIYLTDAVAAFMAAHPDISIEMEIGERQVDIVGEGFDIAIRSSVLEDSSLIARRIASMPLWLVASRTYLDRHGRPEMPEDLADHPCIVNTSFAPTGHWRFKDQGKDKAIAVAARARLNTDGPVVKMVRAGMGLGLCFAAGVRDLVEKGELVRLLQPYEAYDRSVYALYPHSRHLSSKLRLFLDHLLDEFQALR